LSTHGHQSNDRRVFRESPKKPASKEERFLGFLYFSTEMQELKQWPELSKEMEDRPLEGESDDDLDWRQSIVEVQPKKLTKVWRP
jgi:hypothetical protein